MADDDKVKREDLIQVSKDRFLPSEIRDQDPPHHEYSLAKEFAKAAKGFDWKFYSILIIFLGIVIGGTFALTTYIDVRNQQAQFSFDIEDINNLQEQISSTNREEKKVNLAQSQLNVIIKERDEQIVEIEATYSTRMSDINDKGLEAAELKAELKKLKTEKEAEIAKINKTYDPKIQEHEKNVALAQEEYDAKKAKLEADINKAEKIVNNYKRLQQMQIDALKEKYNRDMYNLKAKYNPYFSDPNIKQILRSVSKKNLQKEPLLEDISALHKNKVVTEIEIKAIREKIADYKVIIERLQKIPYTNSVAHSLDVIQNDAFFLITEYERITKKLIKNLEVLQKYQRAFSQIAEFSVDSGIIIDGSNSEDVIFTLKPVVKIEPGDKGMIFREADQYIGTILFEDRYGKITARVVDMTADAKIQALDRIFIRKKQVVPPEPEPETEPDDKSDKDNDLPVQETEDSQSSDKIMQDSTDNAAENEIKSEPGTETPENDAAVDPAENKNSGDATQESNTGNEVVP